MMNVMKGIMDRRILVNDRLDPDGVAQASIHPFKTGEEQAAFVHGGTGTAPLGVLNLGWFKFSAPLTRSGLES